MKKLGLGHRYMGIRMRDDPPIALRPDSLIIFNVDESTGSGTHWVCGNGLGFFFDPFGMPMSPQIKKNYPRLKYRNNNPLQHMEYTSCGYHCIWFLYNDIKSIDEYYKFVFDYPTHFSGSVGNEKYLSKKINSLI